MLLQSATQCHEFQAFINRGRGAVGAAWINILLITITAFVIILEKQDRKLELLLERNMPSLKQK